MKLFMTGTDTNIGKTLVSSWLCLHTRAHYFKPIQSGSVEGCDRETVEMLADAKTYPEIYCFKAPVSPHWAALLENQMIDITEIQLPVCEKLIIEGAGGVFVPLNDQDLMIDLIEKLALPVLLVASSRLGTINHTLLSLAALRARQIPILGVIISGEPNENTKQAIIHHGQVEVLAELPNLEVISREALLDVPLGSKLASLFKGAY